MLILRHVVARRAAAAGALLLIVVVTGLAWTRHRAGASAAFVGVDACARCHEPETTRWRASMHARAMQTPSRESVKAPFSGETFTLHGRSSTFSRQNEKFIVRTDGPDGSLRDFDVAYTFGVYPLQQYLIALPGGRLQALSVSWDNRPSPDGQRWYHLYPAMPIPPGDVQHWTSPSQNWNTRCADCHSTNVRKGYIEADNRYKTTWTDISVACEACHGAGSRHVAWAERRKPNDPARPGEDGLIALHAFDGASWNMDAVTGIAHRSQPRRSQAEIEMCARCHSRRSQLTEDRDLSRPLADSYRPALLNDDLYFADGQIKDEVYEYGSFLQSKMYANGVTCADCHEPHQPELSNRASQVCLRCHQAEKFATPAHHHHEDDSAGSECVSCHMPTRTYMTVDERRDHSFRVPRPDLTLKIGSPNACNTCHAKQAATWAIGQVRAWYGPAREAAPHYGEALAAGWLGSADAEPRLLATIADPATPAIVKATAVSLLWRSIDPQSAPVLVRATTDADPLVRLAAVDVLRLLPDAQKARLLTPLLADSVRSVRVDAARALATVPDSAFTDADRDERTRGLSEWEAVQHFNGDTAAAHVNLGALAAERKAFDTARLEYETARKLEPYFAPAAVNLADLYRMQDRDDIGEQVLRDQLARTPDVSVLHRALGLLLVRRHDIEGAITELRKAVELAPGDAAAQYTLSAALSSVGQ